MSMVPAMVRTEPVPTPRVRVASSAASRRRGMRGESQVVVRRQVHDGPVVHHRLCLLLAVEHPQAAVEPLGGHRLDFSGQEGQRVSAHNA